LKTKHAEHFALFWLTFAAMSLSAQTLPVFTTQVPPKLISLPPVARIQKPEQMLAFCRIRTPWTLYNNPLQTMGEALWIDRPLLHDRSFFAQDKATSVFQNYRVQFGQAREYGLDGLSDIFYKPFEYQAAIEFISSAEICLPDNGNQVMYTVNGVAWPNGAEEEAKNFGPFLARLLASPAAPHLKGKVVVDSYCIDSVPPAELDQFLKILRQKYGDFWFISSLWKKWSSLRNDFDYYRGQLPEKTIEDLKIYLRTYLDVSDGILLNSVNHIDTVDHHFDQDYYQFITKLYVSVLNEPAYRGKLLALGAALGYVNNSAGGTQYEDGTRTLRRSFETALAAEPDLLFMPEWNDLNENACLEPTINRGFSTKRVTRYYLQRLPGHGPLTPLAGDDLRIPNLIVSVKAFSKLDEAAYVELLNVPDGGSSQEYRVRCRLKNEDNILIQEFPERVFKSAELQEQRYAIEPALLAENRAVCPELSVTTASGEVSEFTHLPYTTTRPTWNDDLVCLKQCLRDVARPAKFDVRFSPAPDGRSADFEVDVISPADPIRHVDLLDNDVVVYSYDRNHEYETRKDELAVQVSFNSLQEIVPFVLSLSVENGTLRYFSNQIRDVRDRKNKWSAISNSARIDWKCNGNKRGGLLVISNKEQAVLRLQSPVCDESVPVRDIERLGSLARAYDKTVFITVESARRALDLPEPARVSQAAFRTRVTPQAKDTVYRLRLVTMSGKRCERGPFVMPATASGKKAAIRFAAPETGELTMLRVDTARCPELVYRFDPACGALLKTDYGSRWTATMGGGGGFGGAFMIASSYPKQSSQTAPQWVTENGAWCLKFDGQGNYLLFPAEVLPASGNFTIEFECKPASAKKQFLIRSGGEYQGLLNLTCENGRLDASVFAQRQPSEPPSYFRELNFSNQSVLPVGQWSKVKVTYDRRMFRLSVNDRPSTEFPCDRRAWWAFSPFLFGGWGKDPSMYFEGLLRAIKIKHYVD
jgi:hypothetical protein